MRQMSRLEMQTWIVRFIAGGAAIAAVCATIAAGGCTQARQQSGQGALVKSDVISGVVTGAKGPEAGVWVVAETTELPTRFSKIVVTDDRGRYLLPDLPKANYKVWVRGYGLSDSTPIMSEPGKRVDIKAQPAPSPVAAAQIYPANYWYSLLKPPAENEFPGTGAKGNKIAEGMKTQADFVLSIKEGCEICHQMGTRATRNIPDYFSNLPTSKAKWDRRIQSGQFGSWMSRNMSGIGRQRGLDIFADWTDRIAAGDYPKEAPPRPSGVERNVVLTSWAWGDETSGIHDSVASDERDPTINANGLVWGMNEYQDRLLWLDPKTNEVKNKPYPTRDVPNPEEWFGKASHKVLEQSAYWGDRPIFYSPATPLASEMDSKGRVWATSEIRFGEGPDWCHDGSTKSSAFFPVAAPGSTGMPQLSYYDPATQKFTFIETCIHPDHFRFMKDPDDTLVGTVLVGPRRVLWWFNSREFDKTHDERQALGWCPLVLDTNGDGKIGPWTEPDAPLDPAKDRRFDGTQYHLAIDNAHRAVWLNNYNTIPGRIMRVELGSPNSPQQCKTEVYEVPQAGVFGPRGPDVDPKTGVVWLPFAGSGHLGRFDRSKCKPATGAELNDFQRCKEGWTVYKLPGPNFPGVNNGGSTEWPYLAKVDIHNILGLGSNTVLLNGTTSDSILAFLPDTERWVVMRMPFPNGFYTRSINWRIDDASAGWKGRGLWENTANITPWHQETGKGTLGTIVKFQMRPNPLAD